MRHYKKIRKYLNRIEYWFYIKSRYSSSAASLKKKLKDKVVVPLTIEQKKAIDALWKGKKFDYGWFGFYNFIETSSMSGTSNPIEWYIPDDFFYSEIDMYFNRLKEGWTLDDKNLYELLFKGVNQPKTIARIVNGVFLDADYQKIGKECLLNECNHVGNVIIKPSVGTVGGKGISFWNGSKDTVAQLEEIINSRKNTIIQEVVKQSPTLSQLHPSSLQTIRIMTLYSKGETTIVSVVVRMGRGNAKVDNVSSGGIAVGVDEAGRLRRYAYDNKGNRFEKHPTTDVVFEGIQVPSFSECCDLVRFLAPRLGRTQRLISWDVSVDEKGAPILIEANLNYGELDFHQMCNGPLFGCKTEDVLNCIFKKQI
ncbi:MAG: hypothetical protein J6T22_06415 [Bacteroidales bacterium]|nr:hypothetical protein [Bacteroidales bacterium]